MTEDAALFAAVLAHPEDSLPRLVLADWFDENGEEVLGWALRSVPEIVPFLSDLARLDRLPGGRICEERNGKMVELWDVEYAAELLVRYRDQFPTTPSVPEQFWPYADWSSDTRDPLGPAAFLSQWQQGRQLQISSLRTKAAQKAEEWESGKTECFALTTDPEVFEYRCCLLHELIVRGHDPETLPGAKQHLKAMTDRGHPLGWLPRCLLPFEKEGDAYTVTRVVSNGETSDRPQVVCETVPLRGADAWAAVIPGSQEETNYHVDAREFDLSQTALDSVLMTGWFQALPVTSLASNTATPIYQISASTAFRRLHSAATSASVYRRREWGVYGRLQAWKSFGWLVGESMGAELETILERAGRCQWFRFPPFWWDQEWDLSLGLIALRPDGLSIAVLAATDTN